MASYTSNLKSWGATGQEYPDGYSYLEGEQPVDAWDNFLTSEVVSDINDHLVPLTNSRVESDKGVAGGEPTSPDASHLYYDEGNERLEHYDSDVDDWHGLMQVDGDTMSGALDMGGYDISGVGSISLSGTVDGVDVSAHAADTANPHSVTYTQVGAIQDASGTVSQSHLGFDTATQAELDAHSLGDLSDVTATGEGAGGGFDADTVDGLHGSDMASSEEVTAHNYVFN